MTMITRWDPFREFVTLQDRMNRLFRDPRGPEGQDESLTTTAFAPPVDVYEDEHNVTLKIEVLVFVDIDGRRECGCGQRYILPFRPTRVAEQSVHAVLQGDELTEWVPTGDHGHG